MPPVAYPYLDLDDPVFGLVLIAARNLEDLEGLLARDAAAGGNRVVEFLRASMCQKVWFRPGTLGEYERLIARLAAFNLEYPSVRMARAAFDDLRPGLRHYEFEAERERWWIRLGYAPDFATPFDAESWVLWDQPSGAEVRVGREALPHALGLLARLNGEQPWARVASYADEQPGTRALLDLLSDNGRLADAPAVDFDLGQLPDVLFLNHSSLFVRGASGAVAIDPCIYGFAARHPDPRRNPFLLLNHADAILITHHHWDHMPWATLARVRRDMPVYVPRVTTPTFANTPVKTYLEFLGFERVIEVAPGQTVHAGDVRIDLLPFHGESFGLRSRFDAFTYLVRAGGHTLYGSVDACKSEDGHMDAVIADLGGASRPDVFFFGSSDLAHRPPYLAAGPRHLSNELLDRPDLVRYHPNVVDVERWASMLGPRAVVPFAQFVFDGVPRPDVALAGAARDGGAAAFDAHWSEVRAAGVPEDTRRVMLAWRSQLAGLRAVLDPPLVMLHPMQGLRM